MAQEIETVAVLGAEVMGGQSAGHLANVGIPSWMFDVSHEMSEKAIADLTLHKPSTLYKPENVELITPCKKIVPQSSGSARLTSPWLKENIIDWMLEQFGWNWKESTRWMLTTQLENILMTLILGSSVAPVIFVFSTVALSTLTLSGLIAVLGAAIFTMLLTCAVIISAEILHKEVYDQAKEIIREPSDEENNRIAAQFTGMVLSFIFASFLGIKIWDFSSDLTGWAPYFLIPFISGLIISIVHQAMICLNKSNQYNASG